MGYYRCKTCGAPFKLFVDVIAHEARCRPVFI